MLKDYGKRVELKSYFASFLLRRAICKEQKKQITEELLSEREYLATLVSRVMQNASTETAHAYHKTKMDNT